MIERFIELVKKSPIATDKFINHCIGVYNILKEKEYSDDICNAGLYHSIYGTSYFNVTVQTITNDRDVIRKEIGNYAEKLVYEMCVLPDREKNILTGETNWDLNLFKDIVIICHANLIESDKNQESSQYLKRQIYLYELLLSYLNNKINPFKIINPIKNDIKVFDNLLTHSEHMRLALYCKNSSYVMKQESSIVESQKKDTLRFSCHLTKKNLIEMDLHLILKKVASEIGQDLFLQSYYIGYYDKSTCSADHIDNHIDDCITVLIYPNIFWNELWAGDIKFYKENSVFNTSIDFYPGRIIIFDSKIKHKVMPISSLAEEGRFSITIKASLYKNLFEIMTENNVHISCT